MTRKRGYLITAIVIFLLGADYVYYCSVVRPSSVPVALNLQQAQGDAETARLKAECDQEITNQKAYLDKDILATTETFEKHPVTDLLQNAPVDLDINSNKIARKFRTRIREELAKTGVNFAGKYSVVSVRMTGYRGNYFIVDRSNGHAYNFPYDAIFLDSEKGSNLLVMDSRERILESYREMDPIENACGYAPWRLVDFRPFYFIWENNTLIFVGPKGMTPPLNEFWKNWDERSNL